MFSADFYSGANPGRHALVKIKFHPCALTAEAAWDILDEQDTKQNRAVWMCWLPTMFRQLRHARRIKYEKIPKYILNGEPIAGKRNLVRSQYRMYWGHEGAEQMGRTGYGSRRFKKKTANVDDTVIKWSRSVIIRD